MFPSHSLICRLGDQSCHDEILFQLGVSLNISCHLLIHDLLFGSRTVLLLLLLCGEHSSEEVCLESVSDGSLIRKLGFCLACGGGRAAAGDGGRIGLQEDLYGALHVPLCVVKAALDNLWGEIGEHGGELLHGRLQTDFLVVAPLRLLLLVM